jgi:predicted DCC family thiol-disulfide oxidoreductase YuxK
MQQANHIILYDGECGLCASTVRFIRRRDSGQIFTFLSLQSADAHRIAGAEHISLNDPDTVIYISNGRFYYRSEAAIRVMMALGGFYRLSLILLPVPEKIRDYFYKLVAQNRYRWFGKVDSCSHRTDHQ